MQASIKKDVLIIGSGFGGSICAQRLAHAGLNVALLERGPWRDTIPVRSMGIEDRAVLPRGWKSITHTLRSLQTPLNKHALLLNKIGLYELFVNRQMSVICSSGVGGGSHVYTALHGRANDPLYWDGVSECLSEKSMQEFHEDFLQKMGSRFPTSTDAVPNLSEQIFAKDSIFESNEFTAQYKMGVLFPALPGRPVLLQSAEGIARFEADYQDGGILGCFDGSKTTLDVAYLADAMKKGLCIYDQHEAITISRLKESDTARFRVDSINHKQSKQQTFFVNNIFLAAGTFNTLKLLMNSSRRDKGIEAIPNLGKRFSGNGDSIAWWMKNNTNANYSIGLPCHGSMSMKAEKSAAKFIAVGFSFIENLPFPSMLKNKLMKDLLLIGFGEDENNGCFHFENGKLFLSYDKKSNPVIGEIASCFSKVAEQSGHPLIRFPAATVHPMGGASVHDDATKGVINGWGELHGIPGIYVCDAAALPKALGAPPSMSISAWSAHVAQGFINRQCV